MKRFLQSAVAAAALVVAVPALYAADPIAVQNDAFRIALPAGFAPFVSQTQTATGADGKQITTTNWVSKAPTGEAVVVTLSQMPGKILEPEKLMSSTRDSLLKVLKATLETEEKRDGGERLMFHSDSAFFRSRFVVDGDRFVQLLYVGRSADQRAVPAISQLFDSFEVATVHASPAAPATKPPGA